MDTCALKLVARHKSHGRRFGIIQGNEKNKCKERKKKVCLTL